MDRELTISEARRIGLPDKDPLSGEDVVWAEPTPAQQDDYKTAGSILGGDGARAA